MQVKQLFKVHCIDYTPVELDLLGRYIEGVNYFDSILMHRIQLGPPILSVFDLYDLGTQTIFVS